jgi:hypothetical protein
MRLIREFKNSFDEFFRDLVVELCVRKEIRAPRRICLRQLRAHGFAHRRINSADMKLPPRGLFAPTDLVIFKVEADFFQFDRRNNSMPGR